MKGDQKVELDLDKVIFVGTLKNNCSTNTISQYLSLLAITDHDKLLHVFFVMRTMFFL